ncbi:MAG: hypothetical protein QOF51_3991 [Chloroflexota bacterium]|nr:hypothetical protein [Chloroflexota bacterium]
MQEHVQRMLGGLENLGHGGSAGQAAPAHPAFARETVIGRVLVRIDRGPQVIAIDLPEDQEVPLSRDGRWLAEIEFYPTPLDALERRYRQSGMVPATLPAHKAKQFDDGLYAAIELAAQHGTGRFPGETRAPPGARGGTRPRSPRWGRCNHRSRGPAGRRPRPSPRRPHDGPLFFDLQRKRTKVLVCCGWASRPVTVSFATPPSVQVDPSLADLVRFSNSREILAYPVTAEVYVDKILDRDEVRALCSVKRTRGEIVKALEAQ